MSIVYGLGFLTSLGLLAVVDSRPAWILSCLSALLFGALFEAETWRPRRRRRIF